MKTTLAIAAALLSLSAQAADTKVGASAVSATASAAATEAARPAAAKPRSRSEVRAEAVEAVRNHKTTLAAQLDLLK